MNTRTVLLLLLLGAESVSAQSIGGVVRDAESGDPIPAASIRITSIDGGFEESLSASRRGDFRVSVPTAGDYWIRAQSVGYAPDSARVEVQDWTERVTIEVRLSSETIELSGIEVVTRDTELRHTATLAGFWVRYENRVPVGPSRLVSRRDGILRASLDIDDLFRWFDARNLGCVVYFVDGFLRPDLADDFIIPLVDVTGVEFYRRSLDAPLDLRSGGEPCLRSSKFSIVAIWT